MNLDLYNKVREVPKEAQKIIGAGRLKGFTDVNPMWRIKTMTENFGVCGLGWYYEITSRFLETGADGNIACFVDVDLYIKDNGEWSQPISGTGGSMFVTKESKGLYTDDECFKKALTDALSVCMKALGVGADVYWQKDSTKYSNEFKSNVYDDYALNLKNNVLELATDQGIEPEKLDKAIQNKYNKTLSELTVEEMKEVMDRLTKHAVPS
jgi:hypothetical protein